LNFFFSLQILNSKFSTKFQFKKNKENVLPKEIYSLENHFSCEGQLHEGQKCFGAFVFLFLKWV